MIPGELRIQDGEIEINANRRTLQVLVANVGDRPIQVGSHFPFFEVNRALRFDRAQAFNMRLDIPAGTAVRFEPGEERPVDLVEIGGTKQAFGLNNLSQGEAELSPQVLQRLEAWQKIEGEAR
jgi:urease subunit beta